MAQTLYCDGQDGERADFLIGNTHTGEQLALCARDAGRWGLGMALSQLTPEEFQQALAQLTPPPAPSAPPAEADRPPRRRRRETAPPAQPEPVPEETAAAPAAPAPD